MRRIGGSDISKLLGASRYGNEADVFARIALGVEEESGPAADRGTMFEPVLRAHGQRMFNLELEDRETDYSPHPTLEFAHAQIDDLARWNGLPVTIDYKTQSRFARGWGPEHSDETPESIHAQVAWEMLCADREMGLLVVGFGEDVDTDEVFVISNVVPYQIERDPRFESYCVAVAREFWERHILPGVPPLTKPLGRKAKQALS